MLVDTPPVTTSSLMVMEQGYNMFHISIPNFPLGLDDATLAAIYEMERDYEIFWDDGPWMSQEGYLYYEAVRKENTGG